MTIPNYAETGLVRFLQMRTSCVCIMAARILPAFEKLWSESPVQNTDKSTGTASNLIQAVLQRHSGLLSRRLRLWQFELHASDDRTAALAQLRMLLMPSNECAVIPAPACPSQSSQATIPNFRAAGQAGKSLTSCLSNLCSHSENVCA